jgi:hypothetical protein
MLNTEMRTLGPAEVLFISGGGGNSDGGSSVEVEAGSGDITMSCCSISFAGFELSVDAFGVTISTTVAPSHIDSHGNFTYGEVDKQNEQ